MKKSVAILAFTFFALVAFIPNASAVLVFQGSLLTPDGISGTGDWETDFKISWSVEEQPSGLWKYIYTLTTQSGASTIDTSHTTIEISEDADSSNFSNFNGSPIDFGDKDGITNALKFDYEDNMYMMLSDKGPTWGDFFSKGGRASGTGPANQRPFNTAFNADFGDLNPTDPPQNGLLSDGGTGFIYKILRPDTVENGCIGDQCPCEGPDCDPNGGVIPEPSTFLLLATGLLGFASRRKFF